MRASKIDLLEFARDCYEKQKGKNPQVQGHMTRKINQLKSIDMMAKLYTEYYEQTF